MTLPHAQPFPSKMKFVRSVVLSLTTVFSRQSNSDVVVFIFNRIAGNIEQKKFLACRLNYCVFWWVCRSQLLLWKTICLKVVLKSGCEEMKLCVVHGPCTPRKEKLYAVATCASEYFHLLPFGFAVIHRYQVAAAADCVFYSHREKLTNGDRKQP